MKTKNKRNKRALSSSPVKKRLKTISREEDDDERGKSKKLTISDTSDEIEDSSSSEDSISTDSSDSGENKQIRRKGLKKTNVEKASSGSESLSSDTEGSSEDDETLTRRAFQGKSETKDGKKIEPKCLYRSNINAAVRELRRVPFKDEHLALLRVSPFCLLIDGVLRVDSKKKLSMCKKKDQDVRKIIKTYNAKRECFMIGEEKVKLRNQDFRLTFGICDGSREIDGNLKMEHPEWVKRCFETEIEAKGKKRFSMERSVIYRKLVEKVKSIERKDVEDAVRLVNCYMLAALLITNQNGSMKNEVAALFENLEDAVLYNWSSYMTGLLIRHIKATGGNTKTIGGCAMILPYFICEHSKIIKPSNPLEFPRFLKWDLRKFHKKFTKVEVRELKGIRGKVEPTTEEMDAFANQFKEQLVVIRKLMEEHEAKVCERDESQVDPCNESGPGLDIEKEERTTIDGNDKNVEENYSVEAEVFTQEDSLGKNLMSSEEECFVEDTMQEL